MPEACTISASVASIFLPIAAIVEPSIRTSGRFDFAHAPFPQYAQLAAALELTPFAFRCR